jgi:protein TonB
MLSHAHYLIHNTNGTWYQWLSVFAIALVIHTVTLLSLSPTTPSTGAKAKGYEGIDIGLKKLVASTKAGTENTHTTVNTTSQPKPATTATTATTKVQKPTIAPKPTPKKIPASKPKPVSKTTPTVIQEKAVNNTSNKLMDNNKVSTEKKQFSNNEHTHANKGNAQQDLLANAAVNSGHNAQKPSLGGGNPNAKASYDATLRSWLERFKRYPSAAKRRGQQGIIHLQVTIDRQGKLITYKLLSHSPYRLLNKAVEKMIVRATPLPPVPKGMAIHQDELTLVIPVSFLLQ